MMEIAVINSSRSLRNVDVEFMVQACAAQLLECAAAWGAPPMAAALYAQAASLPATAVIVCEIVDDLDQPGALGYHSDDGRPYIRVLAQGPATSITLSHEFLETLCDPTCDQWRARPDGSQVALEVCDPVEGDFYGVAATVLGETRSVNVSNYVLPSWFDPSLPKGAHVDAMNTVTGGPFAMTAGGYMVVLDQRGNETEVFARVVPATLASAGALHRRLALRNSRLLRRLRSRPSWDTVPPSRAA